MRMGKSMLALFALLLAGCATPPADLSGTWTLNLKKSEWGKVRRPVSVVVDVEHEEPSLLYAGMASYANDDVRWFGFDGAIGGKEYPMSRSYGDGLISIRRRSASTTDSVFRSNDGNFVETVNTSLSRDRRTMTRRIRVKGPAGDVSWTEVYDRQ